MILKSSLTVFSATALAHLINYVYHLIALKFLTPNQFGLMESFVALNYFLAVLISSFSFAVIHQLNQTKKKNQSQLISSLQSFSLKLTFIIWLITLASFPILKRLFHFQNPYLLILFSLQILFSFTPTVYSSILKAKLKFKSFSSINILSPLIKTASALLFFILGLKVIGALASLTLASLAAAFLNFNLVKKHLKLKLTKPAKLPRSFFTFGIAALITNLSLVSLYNSDIILTRFFISHNSGLYASASILSRIIFFISNAILTVTFPIFITQKQNLNRLKHSFQSSLLLITLVTFLTTVFYQLYPTIIIKLFSHPSYTNAANLLPGLAFFTFFFTLLNLFMHLLLIINKRLAVIISAFTALIQITLIFIYHQNLMQIIQNSIIAVLIGLSFTCIISIKLLYAKT